MIVEGTSRKNMERAVSLLKAGELVAFPTETVYGLGGDALNARAVEKIFRVKQRPFADPLIVHVADIEDVEKITLPLEQSVQETALKLMKKFWPGPLTLIFNKSPVVPNVVSGGLGTVGVRMPNHIVARALIKNMEGPLSAPSANRFQSLSPTTADAVEKELGPDIPLILDGGPCRVGVESTVLSLTEEPMILRPGGVSLEDLEYVLGRKVAVHSRKSPKMESLPSPGMLDFHYAPRKPLRVFTKSELQKYVGRKNNQKKISQSALLCFSKSDKKLFAPCGFFEIAVLSEKGNLPEAARSLFKTLRELDSGVAQSIFALLAPEEQLGLALNDRLRRAQHS